MKLTLQKRNKFAFWSAMLSAFFLFISGATGVSGLLKIEELILKFFNFNIIKLLFVLLLIFASLGAISVFIGGFLILKKKIFWGDLLITLGSGAGIYFKFNYFNCNFKIFILFLSHFFFSRSRICNYSKVLI